MDNPNSEGSVEARMEQALFGAEEPDTGSTDAHDDATAEDEAVDTPEVEEAEYEEADDSTEGQDADEDEDSEDDGEADATDESEQQEQEEPELYTIKVNGEEHEVTLEDLKRGHMMERDYRQKTEALSEKEKQFEQQRNEQLQELQSRVQQLDELIQTDDQVDMDELWELDPARARQMEKQQEARKQQSAEAKERLQQEQQQRLQAVLQEESEKLTRAIPDWLDESVAKKEKPALREFMTKELGFKDQEINQLIDHRLFANAYRLMKAEEKLAQYEGKRADVRKKLDKAPKLTKPKSSGQQKSRSQQQSTLRKRARKGDEAAAAQYIENLL